MKSRHTFFITSIKDKIRRIRHVASMAWLFLHITAMKAILARLVLSFLTLLPFASANQEQITLPERLATKLTQEEQSREKHDTARYPHFMRFLKTADISTGIKSTDPRNFRIIPSSRHLTPTVEMWRDFFLSATKDRLTVLRAMALLARELKKQGLVIFGSGAAFDKASDEMGAGMGLALPSSRIASVVWSPDPSIKDPEFQVHLKVFYTEPFVHRFPDNILAADLKIGFGEPQTYWLDNHPFHQHTVETDIYYGATRGVGFRNIKGIGGRKRGFTGFLQKVFFFLPDAVNSMIIDEKRDELVTDALIETRIQNFEKDPKYSVKIEG
jgi:hypothetical protein